ncbi:MAG: GWxTD domain-containing protein [Thermoanaerobaculia bacterium]
MTNQVKMCRTIANALVFVFVATTLVAQSPQNDWLDDPEAVFMTNAERQEWWGFHTDAERDAFKERYWARRDPTPDTPRNEFREMLEQRIQNADKKFTLEKSTRGALTSRGQVYIVLGAPARVNVQQQGYNQLPLPPPPPSLLPPLSAGGRGPAENVEGGANGTIEGNEITERWYYEKSRTPKILEALGRPSLDFVFVVEPVKRHDELQNPGLFNQLREAVAQKTIVNVISPAPRNTAPAAPSIASAPSAAAPVIAAAPQMTAEIETALDHAGDSGTPVRSSVMWNGDKPAATFWLVAPDAETAKGPLALYGRVKDSSGKIVATIARPFESSKAFSLHQNGAVADATFALVPGEYDAAFILNDESNNAAIAAGTAHVVVPETSSQFAVSSLILTDRMDASGEGLLLGRAHVRPRADATFSKAESMWYLFQVANPSDAARLTVAVRLRHGIAPPTSPRVVPAALEPVGPGRYMGGFELPLAELAPGDYTLYVSVHDPAEKEDVVRRADFRVIEGPRLQ